VLLQDAGGNMALVARALQLVGHDAAPVAPPECASLVDSVRVAALKSLVCIVTRAPASAEPHVISLAASLISLTRFAGGPAEGGARPLVRAAALDALRALALLPHQRLHPVRDVVLRGLLPALDDPKRSVRRRAAACRNEWAMRL
jgi:DNA repair/transcription protein MET18/MMS19